MHFSCLCDCQSSTTATHLQDAEVSYYSGENMSASKNPRPSLNPELSLQHSGCVCCFYSHELIKDNVNDVTEE